MDEVWQHAVRQDGGVCTVVLAGELDTSACDDLFRAFVDALNRPGVHTVQVDLDAVDFLDSTGIWALLTAHHAAQALDRGFVVVRARGRARRSLDVAGLLPILCPGTAPTPPARIDRFAG